jgi:CRP-like cAMP-binding protein
MHVLKLLAARVRALDNRVFEYSTLQVGQRICYELLRLAQRDPKNPRRGILESRPTHAEIAARVSTHREAVSRELKKLEREGHLQRQRGTLVLTDMPRLVSALTAESAADHYL